MQVPNARHPMDAEADVALRRDCRLGGVRAHPHADDTVGHLFVCSTRCATRAPATAFSLAEDDEEGTALWIDLPAAGVGERGAKQPFVLEKRFDLAVAGHPQQPRLAFDVSEQKVTVPRES
jgi:hypothetical protein